MGKQRKSTAKSTKVDALKSGKGPPANSVTRALMKEQAVSARQGFDADVVRFQGSNPDLAAVFGYWLGYPLFLEQIGFGADWSAHKETVTAYYALNHVHTMATDILMKKADKYGMDPHAIYECGRVTQEIYRNDPDLCIRRPGAISDIWPNSMGKARYTLPAGQQQALHEGEAVFIRLAHKLAIADEETTDAVAKTVASVLPTLPEIRCAPMSKSEIAKRYLKRSKAKGNQCEQWMKVQGLRQEPDGLWTVRIDNLPPDIRERFQTPLN